MEGQLVRVSLADAQGVELDGRAAVARRRRRHLGLGRRRVQRLARRDLRRHRQRVRGRLEQGRERSARRRATASTSSSCRPASTSRSSDAPVLTGFTDLDFVGSPVVADTPDCGELVAAQAKNGMFFGWNAGLARSGPVWSLKLQKADPGAPLLTQPTWSPALPLVLRRHRVEARPDPARLELPPDGRLADRRSATRRSTRLRRSPAAPSGSALPVKDLSGVAEALLGVDARTGRVHGARADAGRLVRAADRAAAGCCSWRTMHGVGSLRASRSPTAARVSTLPEYTSRARRRSTSGRAARTASTRRTTAAGTGGASTPRTPCGSTGSRRRRA